MTEARKGYADIIDRAHHVSRRRKPMPRLSRAAQFSPFAALTGYDDLVREAARETESRRFPDEDGIEEMNKKLVFLMRQAEPPEATFTWFVADGKKSGGSYDTVTDRIVRYDEFEQCITLRSGRVIFIEDLTRIECAAFENAWADWAEKDGTPDAAAVPEEQA